MLLPKPYIRCLTLFMLLSLCSGLKAQFAFQVHYPNRCDYDFGLQGEVAMIYQQKNLVLGQISRWQYKLAKAEEAVVYLFNEENRLREVIRLREQHKVSAYMDLAYNEEGQLQELLENGEFLSSDFFLKYEYDQKGRIDQISNSLGDKLLSTIYLTHQRKKRHTERTTVEGQSFYFQRELVDGLVQKMERKDSTGEVAYWEAYFYDENNRLERVERRFTDESKPQQDIEYTYELDEQGNWISRMEHNRASGQYWRTRRIIIYREAYSAMEFTNSPVGYWSCGAQPYYLEVEANGRFTLADLSEGDLYQGRWNKQGQGRFRFAVNYEDHLGAPYPLRSNNGLTGELRDGRLLLQLNGTYHFDFLSEQLFPVPEELKLAMKYERWSQNRFSKVPELKQETAVPADIEEAFDVVHAKAPDRFQACLADQCGLIDGRGRVIIPFAYERLGMMAPDLYQITIDGKQGMIDTLGRELLPAKYDRLWSESKLGERIVGTRENGKRYYYDCKTNEFLPFEKDDLRDFNGKRWVIRKDRFVNLYDHDFVQITTDSLYNRITALSPTRYLAGGRDAYRLLNENGKELFVFSGYLKVRKGSYGYLIAYSAINQLYALFDYDGNQITQPLYEELTFCANPKEGDTTCQLLQYKPALAQYKKPNGRTGYLTGMGQEVK